MVAQTMSICLQGITAVFGWMEYVFFQLGVGFWLIGAFTIFSIFRLLIAPVIGAAISSGASDTVKKIRGKSGQNNQGGKGK